jgi:hypothetical protein
MFFDLLQLHLDSQVVFIIGKSLPIPEHKMNLKLVLVIQTVSILIQLSVIIHLDGHFMVHIYFYYRFGAIKTLFKCIWTTIWEKI